MVKDRDLVIVGDSAFAEIAYEYFTHDSAYRVAGFAVERDYLKKGTLFDLPVVALDEVASRFPPGRHAAYVAITYTQLNRLRTRLCQAMKALGYPLASYISSRAFVWRNVTLGEHCFIFENNVVQPFVQIGSNVVLWSGNHIGHHSVIEDNCFVSSHVVISGYVRVGSGSFLGVNATISNNRTIGRDAWIGPNVCLTRDTEPGQFYRLPESEPSKVSSLRFFKLGA
jgi:sugar O-acyltransferase (sialic acid O-acetyltransferase NeuD family)